MAGEKAHTARFAILFAKYEQELRSFFKAYLPNRMDVEDCTQEAFMNMWLQERRGALRDDVRGYLFTTAMNVVRDFWRRDKRRHKNSHVELSESLLTVRSIGAEKTLADRQAVRLLEAQLGKLRPSTKAVFLLYHVEHLTCAEIARRLNISVRTVERELARALESCRSALSDVVTDLLE